MEQVEKPQGNEQQATYVREYVVKVRAELPEIFGGIFALMEKDLIPWASAGESKESYFKMTGGYYRDLAEFATGDAKSEATEDARAAHAKATKVILLVLQERIQGRIVEEIIEVPVSRMMEETIEVVKRIAQEQVQSYTGEQFVAVPVPWIREEIRQVTQLVPQKRLSDHVVEQAVDVPSPQIQVQNVEGAKTIPQERLQRTV